MTNEPVTQNARTRKPLIYGSVCSGIEAATAAWHPLGWKPAFFSEIEAFPRAVLQHQYPQVPLHGDFTTIMEHDYEPIDLLVGGTPCQSFSIAGLRKGLSDERGNLTLEFVRLAQRLKPQWLVWENVPGVLSIDRGRAFGSFLGALAELGYGFAYRTLDAQYFGVPQRRRRVFVVGYLGDWRPPAAVLFERESLLRDITPRREAGESVAPTISARTKGGGGLGTDFDCDGGLVTADWPAEIAGTLDAHYGDKMGLEDQHIFNQNASRFVPAYSIQGAASREKSSCGPDGIGVRSDGVAYTLEARAEVQAVAFAQNTRDELRYIGGDGQVVGALAAEPGMKQQTYLMQSVGAFKGGQGAAAGSIGYDEHLSPTLNSAESGTNRTPALMQGMSVRRLTPRECERLQGFPVDYTLVPHRNKPAADGPRYKALGNSMAVPVMSFIGQRIELIREQQLALAA